MTLAALIMAAFSLSCASSGGATYEDVCNTARHICSAADLLCVLAPKTTVLKLGKNDRVSQLAITMHQLDSLALVLHKQAGE